MKFESKLMFHVVKKMKKITKKNIKTKKKTTMQIK